MFGRRARQRVCVGDCGQRRLRAREEEDVVVCGSCGQGVGREHSMRCA